MKQLSLLPDEVPPEELMEPVKIIKDKQSLDLPITVNYAGGIISKASISVQKTDIDAFVITLDVNHDHDFDFFDRFETLITDICYETKANGIIVKFHNDEIVEKTWVATAIISVITALIAENTQAVSRGADIHDGMGFGLEYVAIDSDKEESIIVYSSWLKRLGEIINYQTMGHLSLEEAPDPDQY